MMTDETARLYNLIEDLEIDPAKKAELHAALDAIEKTIPDYD